MTNNIIESLILNEAYFGNSPELEALQKQLTKARSKFLGVKLIDKYLSNFNTDPELTKLNRQFEQMFGFNAFCLNIEPNTAHNAYVFPTSFKIDSVSYDNNHIVTTNTGTKYKKEYEVSAIVFISSSLWVSDEFTDREVLAIILHEIGHHFQSTVSSLSCANGYIMSTMNLITFIHIICNGININQRNINGIVSMSNTTEKFVLKKIEKLKQTNPELIDCYNKILGLKAAIDGTVIDLDQSVQNIHLLLSPISGMLHNIISGAIHTFINDPLALFKALIGFNDETVADNFVTMYGYAPDLSTALNKINKGSVGYRSIKFRKQGILSSYYNIMTNLADLLFGLSNVHPNNISRITDQLKYLEYELEKQNVDPKMRKEIKKDIEKMNKLLKSINTKSKNTFSNEAYDMLLLFLFKDGDLKNSFLKNTDRYKEIDINIDASRNNNKSTYIESADLTGQLTNIKFR